MPSVDASLEPRGDRPLRDADDIEAIGVVGKVDMKVEGQPARLRQSEHGIEVLTRIGIRVGNTPNRVNAAEYRRTHQIQSPPLSEQPLLGKRHDLQLDPTAYLVAELEQSVDSAQFQDVIKLDVGTECGHSVREAGAQNPEGPSADVGSGEGRFQGRGHLNRFRESCGLPRHSVQQVSLLEMDVGFHKTRDQVAILRRGWIGRRLDPTDNPTCDANIDGLRMVARSHSAESEPSRLRAHAAAGTRPNRVPHPCGRGPS
jgi:hypothetical protein